MLNTAEVPHWENQILGARSEKEANASCVTTSRNDIRMSDCPQSGHDYAKSRRLMTKSAMNPAHRTSAIVATSLRRTV